MPQPMFTDRGSVLVDLLLDGVHTGTTTAYVRRIGRHCVMEILLPSHAATYPHRYQYHHKWITFRMLDGSCCRAKRLRIAPSIVRPGVDRAFVGSQCKAALVEIGRLTEFPARARRRLQYATA